jgi:hypothetical protein
MNSIWDPFMLAVAPQYTALDCFINACELAGMSSVDALERAGIAPPPPFRTTRRALQFEPSALPTMVVHHRRSSDASGTVCSSVCTSKP